MRLRILPILLLLLLLTIPAHAQDNPGKPMQLPITAPAGPSTWLIGQPYGNTTGAFNNGPAWYSAGQGLHFGIDLSMPCGTELVAVADAEVAFVDDMGFGSAPHNLILRHPALGLTSLYGHLLETPPLTPGQFVEKGQYVGLSGDPDGPDCDSRPHLHLEIRSADYRTALNPVDYIDAPWHMLTTIGSFSYPLFQQDMNNARQWMRVDDQPDVAFGGRILNSYTSTWPPPRGFEPPPNPPLARTTAPLDAETVTFTARKLAYEGCCFGSWWNPLDPERLFIVDGASGSQAAIFDWQITSTEPADLVGPGPRPLTSPDGTLEIRLRGEQIFIHRTSDGAEWNVQTQGGIPAISADNNRLFWETRATAVAPDLAQPVTEFWVSDLYGQDARRILAQSGGSAQWLDAHRLLITTPLANRQTILTIFDTRGDSNYTLGSWPWMRGVDISPGGARLMFYITRTTEIPNGIYTIETRQGAQAQMLDWFGSWRWRNADSVYYIPFEPTTDRQSLIYYDIASGASRTLIDGDNAAFTVTGNDWSVSADGRRVVFMSAADNALWLIEQNP